MNNDIPKTLFLRGVFLKDTINDDMIEQKMLENIDYESNPKIQYEIKNAINIFCNGDSNKKKPPQVFTSLDTWIVDTELLCWNCHLEFGARPVFIPTVIEPNMIRLEDRYIKSWNIGVHGIFCGFGCAHSYIENGGGTISEKINNLNNLQHLYGIFYDEKLPNYSKYPSVYSMAKYGGDLSTDEFIKLKQTFE